MLNQVHKKLKNYLIFSLLGPTFPKKCKAVGTGLFGGVVGMTASFFIQAYDEFNNSRTTGGDLFRVYIKGSSLPNNAHIKDNDNGSYSGYFYEK